MKTSPGSIQLAQLEIALSRGQARLFLGGDKDSVTARVRRGGEESEFTSASLTDAIDEACKQAGIHLTQRSKGEL